MHEISKSMRIKAEAANGNANGSGGSRNSRGGRKGSGSPREEATQGEDEDGAGQQQQHLPPHLDHGFPVRFKGPLLIHLVPYSEHSSYNELVEFVKWLRPKQVRFGPFLPITAVQSLLIHYSNGTAVRCSRG
eukprot:1159621-Pelagomonas_calceolata.AAC.17